MLAACRTPEPDRLPVVHLGDGRPVQVGDLAPLQSELTKNSALIHRRADICPASAKRAGLIVRCSKTNME